MILFKIFYITGILLFVLNLIKAKFDYTKCLLLAVCAYLSFKYIKNTPFFIIVSLVFFYEYISLFLNKFLNSKFVTYIIYLCSFAIFLYPTVQNVGYSYLSEQPVREAEFIKINDLKGNILAPFDMGSYLVYKLYPNNLIYMDGRYEEVYYSDTKKELDDFFNIEKENYYVLDKNISPDYIIVPLNALVNDYLLKRDDYKLIYRNDENVIYSQIKNLKTNYILPSNDYSYYTKNAFKTNFTFSDDITVNGQKVIFR